MGEANFTGHFRPAGSQAILEASIFMAEEGWTRWKAPIILLRWVISTPKKSRLLVYLLVWFIASKWTSSIKSPLHGHPHPPLSLADAPPLQPLAEHLRAWDVKSEQPPGKFWPGHWGTLSFLICAVVGTEQIVYVKGLHLDPGCRTAHLMESHNSAVSIFYLSNFPVKLSALTSSSWLSCRHLKRGRC